MKKNIKELLKIISLILVVSFIIPVNIATAFLKIVIHIQMKLI